MAEPIVLFMEKKLESYSLGKDISMPKAQDIFKLALRHGFKIGPLTSRDSAISQEHIAKIKDSLLSKGRGFFIFNRWANNKK